MPTGLCAFSAALLLFLHTMMGNHSVDVPVFCSDCILLYLQGVDNIHACLSPGGVSLVGLAGVNVGAVASGVL